MKKGKLLLILLVLFSVALGIRWVAMIQNHVIASDAVLYINSAKLYSQGDYAGGFKIFPRSSFPLFIVIAQRIFGDWIKAGQWVCAFFGALAVIPLYLLARRIFNEKIALVSAFFYMICPSLVRNAADILRDTPLIFFSMTALWLGYKGIKESRPGIMGLAGLFVLLSASLKDYGLMNSASMILFLGWYVIKRQIALRKALMLFSIFSVGIIAVLFPLSFLLDDKKFDIRTPILVRAESAFMGITHQRSVMSNIRGEMESLEFSSKGKRILDLAMQHRFALYSYHIFSKTLGAFHIILFILFLFGLINRRIISYRMDEFLLFTVFVVYLPLFLLFLSYSHYLQTKNTFPILVPSLIWSGVGFEEIEGRWRRWIQNRNFQFKELASRWFTPLFILFICIPLVLLAWSPRREDRLWVKELGTRLRNNGYSHSIIVGQQELAHDLFRMAFYAESEFIPPPQGTYEELIRFARERRANLLVVDRRRIDLLAPNFFDKITPLDLIPINITGMGASNCDIIIFRVVDQK